MSRAGRSSLSTLNPLGGRRLVVIDPGTRFLKLLAVKSRAGRVRVWQQHTVDLAGEGVLGLEETRQHLESLFPELQGFDRAVLIPQDRTICQTVDVPVGGDDEAREYLLREARKLSGLAPDSLSYGFTRLHPFGRFRNPWWMTLCKREEVDELTARFLVGEEIAGGLEEGGLCEIAATAQALFAASRMLRPRPANAVLVECRSRMTVVAMLVDGQGCFATSLPTGFGQLAEACAQDDGVPPEDAAKALRGGPGFDSPGPHLREAVEVWHAGVQTAVREWLDDNPELRLKLDELPAPVCGSGARGGGLLRAVAGLGPLKLRPWDCRMPGGRGDVASYWPAFGLALHALQRGPHRLSLLPADLAAAAAARRRWRRWQRVNVLLLLVSAAVLYYSTMAQRRLLDRKEALRTRAGAVLQATREMVSLHARLHRDYVALHPVLAREQSTLDVIEALAALREPRTNRNHWYVLLADAASYAAGTTLPPTLRTSKQPDLPPDPDVNPREYIAEVCVPDEGGTLSTLSDLVGELRQRPIFRNVDALPPERRRNLVNPAVVVTNRVYAISLEMAGEAPQPPRALAEPTLLAPPAEPAPAAQTAPARRLPTPVRVLTKPSPRPATTSTNR